MNGSKPWRILPIDETSYYCDDELFKIVGRVFTVYIYSTHLPVYRYKATTAHTVVALDENQELAIIPREFTEPLAGCSLCVAHNPTTYRRCQCAIEVIGFRDQEPSYWLAPIGCITEKESKHLGLTDFFQQSLGWDDGFYKHCSEISSRPEGIRGVWAPKVSGFISFNGLLDFITDYSERSSYSTDFYFFDETKY